MTINNEEYKRCFSDASELGCQEQTKIISKYPMAKTAMVALIMLIHEQKKY